MRAPIFLLTLGGLAVAATSFHVVGNSILVAEPQASDQLVLEVPSLDELEQPSDEPLEIEPLPIRPVAPDTSQASPVDGVVLERVEEREPLSPLGRATRPSDLPPTKTVLYRPVVTAAGSFEAQGHKIVLEGIEVTAPDTVCGEGAAQWRCGIHARTAFRTWLRGRAMGCTVTPVPVKEVVTTDCSLGSHDPAKWLVEQGWVKAIAGGPYAELGATAEKERRGLFGPAPDGALSDQPASAGNPPSGD
jgi:endonuclease YncB( thermonuclease family)